MVLTNQNHSSGDVSPTYANMDEIQDLLKAYSSEEYLFVAEAEPQGLIMQSQYRDPPPYPGHSKQMAQQPSLRKSFSGSETSTDVSVSSLENLSSSQRQEPQGEETATPTYHHHTQYSEEYSIMARLAHESKTQQTSVPYCGQVPHPTDHRGYLNSGPFYPWAQHTHLVPPGQKGVIGEDGKSGDFSDNSQLYNSNVCSSSANTAWTGSNPQQATSNLQADYFTNLTPPPQYPGIGGTYDDTERTKMRRSYETVGTVEMKSCHSQPDLHRYWATHSPEALLAHQQIQHPPHNQSPPEVHQLNPMTLRPTDMVEILTEENKRLRDEISIYSKKVSKLQKFELEIQKVHEAYESLVQSSQKREKLEKIMKKRLEEEIKKLHAQNKTLKEKLEKSSHGSSNEFCESLREEGASALLSKSKELQNQRDRLELEVATLKTTVQEKTEQLDILDDALTNAQANVVRLEKECCVKQVQMERLDQLQKAFSLLQATCEKREQMETKLRTNLEKKLIKSQEKASPLPKKEAGSETVSEMNNIYSLQRLLNEKEAKILQLETEVVKWEQKYLEENMRQLAIQNPELRDQWTMDTDRQASMPKAEKVGPVEDVLRLQISELESKVKSLQTQLAEKDAMIRVFQRAPMTRSSSVHTLNYCTPLHSPRPSLIASGTLTRQGSQSDSSSFREFPVIRHCKTGSTSALETGRKFSLENENLTDNLLPPHQKSESKDSSDDEGDKVWQV